MLETKLILSITNVYSSPINTLVRYVQLYTAPLISPLGTSISYVTISLSPFFLLFLFSFYSLLVKSFPAAMHI